MSCAKALLDIGEILIARFVFIYMMSTNRRICVLHSLIKLYPYNVSSRLQLQYFVLVNSY